MPVNAEALGLFFQPGAMAYRTLHPVLNVTHYAFPNSHLRKVTLAYAVQVL